MLQPFGLLILSSVLYMATSMATTSKVVSSSCGGSSSDMQFSRFHIPASHIFYRTTKSAAFVNLRPIVPGHVLVMPERIVANMEELEEEEYIDLWKAVRQVQTVLKHKFAADAFNIAVQDGRAAGQSVPHVHVHILPRKGGDFARNDDVYDALEAWAPNDSIVKESTNIDVPDDEDRKDRTVEMMADEAGSYREIFEKLYKL